ncbi:hypothetical protein [Clostridium intestinale]|uniref:Uncharacterized protein n=1 Tax=Clostridium intestinale TaxID=36845 RepID=A0A7D7A0R2_9CLOT|nr:hypothetical protein [Clostridium intestinale]QLY77858.1 hypothetical protein HZF06_12140 [Clostridium intestinale]
MILYLLFTTHVVKITSACYDDNIVKVTIQPTKSQFCCVTQQRNKNDGIMFNRGKNDT